MAIGDKKSAVMQSDIVNDFTTGGATNVLSAEMGKSLAQRPNPNLLDNWYFGNPVDQRSGYVVPLGKTYYIRGSEVGGVTDKYYNATLIRESDTYSYWSINVDGATRYVTYADAVRSYIDSGYAIDRWKIEAQYTGDAVTIKDNGLEVVCGGVAVFHRMLQIIEKPELFRGKTVTLSVKIVSVSNEGQTCGAFGYFVNGVEPKFMQFSSPGVYSFSFTVPDDTTEFFVHFGAYRNYSFVCNAVKLELGSQQTLAHQDADGNWVLNEIPNYHDEFLKCIQSTADSNDIFANKVITTNDKICNPNLLDNWYFLNPVNQRGKTTYGSLGNNPYTIDRWRAAQTNADTATIEVTSNGINIKLGTNNGLEFSQRFEPERLPVIGKTVTLSIDVGGTIYSVTNVAPFSQRIAVGEVTVEFSVMQVTDDDTTYMRMYIMPLYKDLLNIHAIKLELGSISTLANDVHPNYQQELAKCQRYFIRCIDNYTNTANIGSGIAYSDKVFACVFPLPVPIRTVPTFSMSDGVYVSNERNIFPISEVKVGKPVGTAIALECTTSGLTVGYPYFIKLGGNGTYIDLTADL